MTSTQPYKPGAVAGSLIGYAILAAVALLWRPEISLLAGIAWAGLAALKIEILHDEKADGPYGPLGIIETGGGGLIALGMATLALALGAFCAYVLGHGIYAALTDLFESLG